MLLLKTIKTLILTGMFFVGGWIVSVCPVFGEMPDEHHTSSAIFVEIGSGDREDVRYHYFSAVGCSNCIKLEHYFKQNDIYEYFDITYHEIKQDPGGLELLKSYLEQLEIPLSAIGTPFMVIEKLPSNAISGAETLEISQNLSFLMGVNSIIKYFETLDIGGTEMSAKSSLESGFVDADAVHNPLRFLGVMVPMALADSINPCAFAVMLLLLSTIFSKSKSKKKTMFSGLLFSLAVFLSYFLMGIGILKFLWGQGGTLRFKRIVGLLGMLIGLGNIKDYFRYGEWFLMEVPHSWRPRMMKLVQSVLSPTGAFLIGVVVSFFLLPCSMGPYAVILGLIESDNVWMSALGMSYLALYNLLFILPMVVITFLVGTGQSTVESLARLKNQNTKLIHLIVGVVMFLLGAYVIASMYLPAF